MSRPTWLQIPACGTACRLDQLARLPMLRCGIVGSDNDQRQRLTRTDYALCAILRGKMDLQFNDTDTILLPGAVFQRLPGTELISRHHGPWHMAFIGLPRQTWELMQLAGHPTAHVVVPGSQIDQPWVDQLAAFIQHLRDCPRHELTAALHRAMGLILQALPQTIDTGADPQLQRACNLLDEQITTPLPLIAEQVDMGYHHFRRWFKQLTGIAPGTYQLTRRMELAMSLLSQPDISIGQIADRLGFCDTPAFSTGFKKHTGHTPGQWRKIHQTTN